MSRFYINDGAVPGRRSASVDYGSKLAAGAQSSVLSEAQAIAKGLKLAATQGQGYRYWEFLWDAGAGSGLINEIQFRDKSGAQLIAGLPGTVVGPHGGYDGNAVGSTTNIPTDSNTTDSTSAGAYFGFGSPVAGCGLRYDLGAPKMVKDVTVFMTTAYKFTACRMRAGATIACADFDSGSLAMSTLHQQLFTIS